MSLDVILNADGDLPHRPRLAGGRERVEQRLRAALATFRGDLILDVKRGIDYPAVISARPVDVEALAALAVAELSRLDEVESVSAVEASFSSAERRISISATVIVSGEALTVSAVIFSNQGASSALWPLFS